MVGDELVERVERCGEPGDARWVGPASSAAEDVVARHPDLRSANQEATDRGCRYCSE